MKILILTQYFPPETGAPQNRLYELAVRLKQKGAEITVLTAMPNYPQMEIQSEFKGKLYDYKEDNGLKIHRSYIFVSKNKNLLIRLANYFSFVFSSLFIGSLKLKRFDFILCESPPLFLGISALILCKLKRAKLIFNVSDLWPESAEKLGLVTNAFFLKMATFLEEFLYKKASLITGQTQGIVTNISSRFPDKKVYWLPNGVDLEFYNSDKLNSLWRENNKFASSDFVLLYAGIIGYAQGLEVILQAANSLKHLPSIKFVLLGNGPEKERLIKLTKTYKLEESVMFIDSVPKNEMPPIIRGIDAAIIPLKRLDLFKGAIPSKIFENLAMKKPILIGVEGEAKELFIDRGKAGLAFIPENSLDLAKKIIILYENKYNLATYGENGYKYVKEHFERGKIASKLWDQLNNID